MSVKSAFEQCQSYQIRLDKDWFQLGLSEKAEFVLMAKKHRYADPKHPLGRSRGYCFYLALQRLQDKWHEY